MTLLRWTRDYIGALHARRETFTGAVYAYHQEPLSCNQSNCHGLPSTDVLLQCDIAHSNTVRATVTNIQDFLMFTLSVVFVRPNVI